jgi:hypothetical protein
MGFNFNLGLPKPIAAHSETIAKLEGEIARGVKDGTLTSAESKKLYTELAQLRSQLGATSFGGSGLFGNALAAASQSMLSQAEAKLGANIDQARANGDVNGHRLRHSNIGVAAQQINRLEGAIEAKAQSGELSPRETGFLKSQLGALKEAFAKAVGTDGKLDATEQKQLEDMQRQIRSDAFDYASKPIRR